MELAFRCIVKSGLDFSDSENDALWLGNVASAAGSRPSVDDPTKPMEDPDNPGRPLPVDAEDTDPAFPEESEYVVNPDVGDPDDPTTDLSDPNASMEKDPDSPGEVTIDPDAVPDDPDAPGFDPDKPHDKTYEGTITIPWRDHEPGEPNPGRVTLKLETDSPAPVTVTTPDGTVVTADLVRDEDGNPVRDENGKYTVWIDPETPGVTELTVRQEPNGEYPGTTFHFMVTVTDDSGQGEGPKPLPPYEPENVTGSDGDDLGDGGEVDPDGLVKLIRTGDALVVAVLALVSLGGAAAFVALTSRRKMQRAAHCQVHKRRM